MVSLGKWQGDRYTQGDHYIQVNFAENIRQLKILGSCPVTVIYRVTTIIILYTGQLGRKYKATENFGKLSGDRNIQGVCYIGPLYTGLTV